MNKTWICWTTSNQNWLDAVCVLSRIGSSAGEGLDHQVGDLWADRTQHKKPAAQSAKKKLGTRPLIKATICFAWIWLYFFAVFITFTFHTVEKSQFRALGHCDLKNHLVSHTGEKPLRFMPSLGNNALFLIISFHSSRYRGLHWGWAARDGGNRCWERGPHRSS